MTYAMLKKKIKLDKERKEYLEKFTNPILTIPIKISAQRPVEEAIADTKQFSIKVTV